MRRAANPEDRLDEVDRRRALGLAEQAHETENRRDRERDRGLEGQEDADRVLLADACRKQGERQEVVARLAVKAPERRGVEAQHRGELGAELEAGAGRCEPDELRAVRRGGGAEPMSARACERRDAGADRRTPALGRRKIERRLMPGRQVVAFEKRRGERRTEARPVDENVERRARDVEMRVAGEREVDRVVVARDELRDLGPGEPAARRQEDRKVARCRRSLPRSSARSRPAPAR